MIRMPTNQEIQGIIQKFPAGTRVEVIEMEDPLTLLNQGDQGIVTHVDDLGQIHVKWDKGYGQPLIYGVDNFKKVRRAYW